MSAEMPVLELVKIEPARSPSGGWRVWRCTLRPVEGADPRSVVLDLKPGELRNWDTFSAAVVKHFHLFYTIRPALPAALKLPPGLPRGFLPEAWEPAPGAPPAFADFNRPLSLINDTVPRRPDPVPDGARLFPAGLLNDMVGGLASTAGMSAQRRQALLELSPLGRAILARGK